MTLPGKSVQAPTMALVNPHLTALRLLLLGARREGLTFVEHDVSGSCTKPVTRHWDHVGYRDRPGVGMSVTLHTRCRRCEKCREHRQSLWLARAMAETSMSQRTWMVTLTLRPERHVFYQVEAERRCRRRSVPWNGLGDLEREAEVHNEIGKELTRWLKRVRKNSGAILRLLCVAERHQSGLPHYHLLVHEVAGTVTNRDLRDAWTEGFSLAKLADGKAPWYVCKYISKEARQRVRASLHYGLGYLGLGEAARKRLERALERSSTSEADVRSNVLNDPKQAVSPQQLAHSDDCGTEALSPACAVSVVNGVSSHV